jgi:hypothetical protein
VGDLVAGDFVPKFVPDSTHASVLRRRSGDFGGPHLHDGDTVANDLYLLAGAHLLMICENFLATSVAVRLVMTKILIG